LRRIQPTIPLRPRDSIPVPRIGIIGGGLLAKMTASAAAKFGCEVIVYERQEDFPAHSVDTHAIVGDWDDPDQLMKVPSLVDVVTLQNEFVSLEALGALDGAGQFLRPHVITFSLLQGKLLRKSKVPGGWASRDSIRRRSEPAIAPVATRDRVNRR